MMGCGNSRIPADNVSETHSESPRDVSWLELCFHGKDRQEVMKPHELETKMTNPPEEPERKLFNRIFGSMMGLAIGDSLGAHVEFRPRNYLLENPVTDLEGGGTWGLKRGQFTDDTSMALCLANSLISCRGFYPYDQLLRYKWWYRHGYMSSTGQCFDIGAATRKAVQEFERRQSRFAASLGISEDQIDLSKTMKFDFRCGAEDAAGNGSLMRLAPVPLFFYRLPEAAVYYSGESSDLTHGDKRARDACRFYGALIVGALQGLPKEKLLDPNFYEENINWFNGEELHEDIKKIAKGSYKNRPNGYDDGIRGKGYVVNSLEAALWAFDNDGGSFEKGALKAVNLGDDTDTTAAIYGQLAGAYYGHKALPERWTKRIYATPFIGCLSAWLAFEGERWTEMNCAQYPKSKL